MSRSNSSSSYESFREMQAETITSSNPLGREKEEKEIKIVNTSHSHIKKPKKKCQDCKLSSACFKCKRCRKLICSSCFVTAYEPVVYPKPLNIFDGSGITSFDSTTRGRRVVRKRNSYNTRNSTCTVVCQECNKKLYCDCVVL